MQKCVGAHYQIIGLLLQGPNVSLARVNVHRLDLTITASCSRGISVTHIPPVTSAQSIKMSNMFQIEHSTKVTLYFQHVFLLICLITFLHVSTCDVVPCGQIIGSTGRATITSWSWTQFSTTCHCSLAANDSVLTKHMWADKLTAAPIAGWIMKRKTRGNRFTYHSFIVQETRECDVNGRRGAEGCMWTERGTDGVRGHQQVWDSCDGKRQKVKGKCWRERVN